MLTPICGTIQQTNFGEMGTFNNFISKAQSYKSLGNDYIIVTTKKFWEDIIKESLKISNKWSQSLEKKVDN